MPYDAASPRDMHRTRLHGDPAVQQKIGPAIRARSTVIAGQPDLRLAHHQLTKRDATWHSQHLTDHRASPRFLPISGLPR